MITEDIGTTKENIEKIFGDYIVDGIYIAEECKNFALNNGWDTWVIFWDKVISGEISLDKLQQ
jgi:hypothetical protein